MTNFLVNLLSPIFTSLGVSVADLTSYIERLSGYIIAIFYCISRNDRSNDRSAQSEKGSSSREFAGRQESHLWLS